MRRVVGLAAVAVLIGGTTGCLSESRAPTPDGSSPGATASSASASTAPLGPALALDWVETALPGAVSLEDGEAAAAGPPGLLIIGAARGGTGLVATTSLDGRAWTPTRPLAASALGGRIPNHLAGTPDGFIAFTVDGPVRVWASRDGIAWAGRGELPGLINVDRFAQHGSRMVACGQREDGHIGCTWSADDGVNWFAPKVPPDWGPDERIEGLAVTDVGFVVLAFTADGVRVRHSPDGERWTDIAADGLDPPSGWAIGGLAPSGRGLVVGGTGIEPDRRAGDRVVGTIWATDDDGRWIRLALPGDAGSHVRVTALRSGLVAWATRLRGQSFDPAGAWVSPDGLRWASVTWPVDAAAWPEPLPFPGGFAILDEDAVHVATWRVTEASWPEPAPAPDPAPAPSPPPEPPGAIVSWVGPEPIPDAADVTALDDGFLVAGTDGADGPAVWRSVDPIAGPWRPVALPPKVPAILVGHTWTGVAAVAAAGPVVVAVGRRWNSEGERSEAVFWLSADGGATWEVLPATVDDDLGMQVIEGPEVGLRDVAAGWGDQDGFVAIGSTSAHSVAWTSAEGRSWERSEPFGDDQIVAVTATGGNWVAVGRTSTQAGPRAAAWRSPDRIAWARVVVDAPPLSAVTYDPARDRIVAVGDGPGILVSDDHGTTWTWVPDQPDLLARGADGRAATTRGVVTTGEGGFVAVGERGCRQSLGRCLAAWTSSEGMRWTAQDPREGDAGEIRLRATALAEADGVVVAVGWVVDSGAVWVGRVSEPAR